MKQKIVLKVQMVCKKCKRKAMTIAAAESGVISVSVQGDTQLVVIGIEVDPVGLTRALRKKLGVAIVISVEEVKDQQNKPNEGGDKKKKSNKDQQGKENKQQNKGGGGDQQPCCSSCAVPPYCPPPCNYYYPQPGYYCPPCPQPQYCMYQFPSEDPALQKKSLISTMQFGDFDTLCVSKIKESTPFRGVA